MKKKFIVSVLCWIMILAFAGCGKQETPAPEASDAPKEEAQGSENEEQTTPASGDEIEVGILYCTLYEEFGVKLQKGFQEQAAEEGYKLHEVNYNLDVSKGSDEMENLINMGVDAIILWPSDPAAFVSSVDKAMAAGIPVIVVDSSIETECSVFITSDHYTCGKLQAEEVVKMMDGKGKVLLITSPPIMSSMTDRENGALDVFKEYPDIEVISQLDDVMHGREGFATTVENALTANPDVDFVISSCSDCALGALTVVQAYPEKYANVKITGGDCSDEVATAIKDTDSMAVGYSLKPVTIAKEAMGYVKKTLDGSKFDTVFVDGELYTDENIDSFTE